MLSPELEITATSKVNATETTEGAPVHIRLYQLREDAALRSASFDDIWQNDEAVLKDVLLKREEHTIYPGQKSTLVLKPDPKATKLAVVALFQEPQANGWFVTYALTSSVPAKPPCPAEPPRFSVWLDRMQIEDAGGHHFEAAETSSVARPGD